MRPDPTEAYAEAVKAVEGVACPLLCPDDRGATLGKAINIVNIMYADTRDINGVAFGQMLLQLPEQEKPRAQILAYAKARGIICDGLSLKYSTLFVQFPLLSASSYLYV